jgi:hypothetical protein
MASLETTSSRDNSEAERRLAEQKKQQEQREANKPPETPQDIRNKEVFRIVLPVIKEALAKQKQIMEQIITELKAKELTFGNFTNPENLLGLSTLVRWDGKTNTGERLETIENFQARSNIVFSSLLRLEYALSSGQRMEDIQKDPSMVTFFMSPEAKYMIALSGWMPVDTAMQEYNLRKARNLKDFIINWDILAESYYDKLKWTPYEAQADKERMGKLEYARKKWLTDFGNTFLSLDQLGLLVAWWAIWKWVWAAVAMSPKLAQVSVQATEKLSNGVPWVVTKIIPWVNAIKTQVGEWLATSLGKFGVNFSLEVWKFAWYEALAKQFWGDDTAKVVAMLMMVIPWAKEGFASSLRAKVAKEWKQIQAWEIKWEFVKWIETNYWEEKAKQMLYAGLIEAKMQSGKMTKSGYDTEVGSAVEKMIEGLNWIRRVEQKVEDISRAPLKLRPIESKESQKLTPEQVKIIWEELEKVIGTMKYNSLDRTADLLKLFEARKVNNPNYTLLDAFKEFKIQKTPEQFLREWGNCVAMCEELQRNLSANGMKSNIVYFEANGWLRNQQANEYVGTNHSGLIIPRIEHGEQVLTFLDPWLFVPKPLTFREEGESAKVFYAEGQKWAQVIPNPNPSEYSQLLHIWKQWDDIWKTYSFKPKQTIINPQETISKDVMRGLTDFKMVKQSPEWETLALVRIDIVSKKVTIQAGKAKQEISFDTFDATMISPDSKVLLEVTAKILNETPQVIKDKLKKIIQYSELYKAQIWNPSNRNN